MNVIHLKLIPGASFEYIERAVELADRVAAHRSSFGYGSQSEVAPHALAPVLVAFFKA